MKRATSIVKGSLRLVSLVITIVTVVTFATIGYSAYQEYKVLVSPQASHNLQVQTSLVGLALRLTIAGSLPNDGLYPLDFSITLAVKAHGSILAQSASQPIRILPNEVKHFNISLDVNPYQVRNATERSLLLTNGSQISFSTGVQAVIEPFAGIKVASGSNLTLPALVGDLKVGPAQVLQVASGTTLTVPISFVDKAGFSFPFSVYSSLKDRSGIELGNSSAFEGIAISGSDTSFKLSFTFAGQRSFSGSYPLELEMTIGGVTVPVQTSVQVSG